MSDLRGGRSGVVELYMFLASARRVVGRCDVGVGEESARYERAWSVVWDRWIALMGRGRCHFTASVSAIAVDC